MKKYFFSIVTLFAVTFTVLSLSSCGKDDDEKQEEVKEYVSYAYNASLSDDILTLYDVEVVAKYDDKSEAYAFTEPMKFGDFDLQTYISGKSTGDKSFSAVKDSGASITCTLKVKSNWKELVASMYKVYITYRMNADVGQNYLKNANSFVLMGEDVTQEKLQVYAETVSKDLTVK